MPENLANQRQTARDIQDDALAALSLTRNNEAEITSTRQLSVLENAARQILSMRTGDPAVDDWARSTLARVASARQWTWVDLPVVTVLTSLALIIGVGSAGIAGTGGNVVLAAVGFVVSSVLLSVVVLRYRRQNWRVRAEEIAPMIWQHGV